MTCGMTRGQLLRALASQNWVTIVVYFAIAACLSARRPATGVLAALAIALGSYWGHRLSHDAWFALVLPLGHAQVHHERGHWMHRLPWLAEAHEVATNLVVGGAYVALLPGLVTPLLPLWTALTYTGLHYVNFHAKGPSSAFHRAHHGAPRANFGPSFFDAAFGTYTMSHVEDMRSWVPTMVVMAVVAAAIWWWLTLGG